MATADAPSGPLCRTWPHETEAASGDLALPAGFSPGTVFRYDGHCYVRFMLILHISITMGGRVRVI